MQFRELTQLKLRRKCSKLCLKMKTGEVRKTNPSLVSDSNALNFAPHTDKRYNMAHHDVINQKRQHEAGFDEPNT